MEWLTGDLLDKLTAPALLLLGFLFFMLGLIRPKSSFTEIKQDRDYWREAHRVSEVAREAQAIASREQLELARAAVDALRGFRTAAVWLEQERGDPS